MSLAFPCAEISFDAPALRAEVRAFVDRECGPMRAEQRANSWARFDAEFSRKLGERGWIGMTFPKRYGGHERSVLERYVVIEELLAAGAPVAAHWISDRQSAHNILRHGSESMKEKWLPRLLKGAAYCVIGMSEPNSGSDLASVRSRATRVQGGWKLNGQKIWTSQAHRSHLMIALVRTSGEPADRQRGLSQFLVELDSPGVRIRPIVDAVGESDFNEVFLEDVFVPDAALLGDEGDGWKLVNSELALERSGPERYLSSYALFVELLRVVGTNPDPTQSALIGRIAAHLWALRLMSLSVAGSLSRGESASTQAVVVKDLGNAFEQEMPRWIQAVADTDLALESDADFARVMAYLLRASPSFSLRGGTREILRGLIARELGLR
jgi:alkylation response protein AidB-like acyl-CoA dehydrogenase